MTARKKKIATIPIRKVGRPQKVPAANAQAIAPKETKQATIIWLLKRPEGALLEELVNVTGWKPHSVLGALSGVLKKRLGLQITLTPERRGKVYRIVGNK